MAYARNGDVSLYYEADGGGETVAFVGDVGFGAWQWGWQAPAVAGPYAAVVPDSRGCGRSDAPPGPYSVEALRADLAAVLDDYGTGTTHLVGAGLGGMVALSAALAPDGPRVRSLALLGTAAAGEAYDPTPPDPDDPDTLRESLPVSARFRREHPDEVDRIVAWRREEDADREAWAALRAAVEGFDVADRLHEVTVPALVVHGTADEVCPVEAGRALAGGLPRGEFVAAEGAGHLAHVEHSRAVTDRLLAFLEG